MQVDLVDMGQATKLDLLKDSVLSLERSDDDDDSADVDMTKESKGEKKKKASDKGPSGDFFKPKWALCYRDRHSKFTVRVALPDKKGALRLSFVLPPAVPHCVLMPRLCVLRVFRPHGRVGFGSALRAGVRGRRDRG